jgi:hypothetical protein
MFIGQSTEASPKSGEMKSDSRLCSHSQIKDVTEKRSSLFVLSVGDQVNV